MVRRTERIARLLALGVVAAGLTALVTSCSWAEEDVMNPEQARDALVTTIEESASILDVTGWSRTAAPDAGNCAGESDESVDYNYWYSAPPQPERDHAVDARKIADHWTSLGMQVRVVESPSYVVYASGGPVAGLSFSTAPGNYYIVGTSLCVPGDDESIG